MSTPSKTALAKERLGYQVKPNTCSKCFHFTSTVETITTPFGNHTHESNLRCGLGGFAVKKTATCKLFEEKLQPI